MILQKRHDTVADDLYLNWLAHNLQYKSLKNLMKDLKKKSIPKSKKKAAELSEVQDNWRKLASIMGGIK